MVDWDNFDARLDNNMASLIHGSTKFIVLKRLIEEEVIKNNKKILIFSGFDYALDCCEALVATMGVPSLRLDGNTCYATRKYNIHRFQNLPQNKVFIMATRAGGEGITLTAAEVVVFLDFDWNPQVTAQAEARAYRIGQNRPVTVYKLCTRGTVEEQMQNRVNKKLYLASKIIDNFMNTNSDASQSDSIESDSKFIQNLIRQDQRASKMTTLDADDMLIMDWKSILNLSKNTPNDEEEDDVHPSSSPPPTPHTASFNEDETAWLSRNERVRTNLFEGKVFLRFREQRKPELLTDLDLFNRRLNKNRVVYDESIDYFVTKDSTLCKNGEAVPTLTAGDSTKVEEVDKIKFHHLKVSCLPLICLSSEHVDFALHSESSIMTNFSDRLVCFAARRGTWKNVCIVPAFIMRNAYIIIPSLPLRSTTLCITPFAPNIGAANVVWQPATLGDFYFLAICAQALIASTVLT